MGLYVFAAMVGALCALAGLGLYRSFLFEKKMSKRLDLVVRASHTCASRMNTACEKLDTMQEERKGNFDFQRKVSEHQRVLLASLNRQIQNLESHFSGGTLKAAQDPQLKSRGIQKQISATAQNSGRLSIESAIENANKVVKPGSGVVRLEEMFRNVEMKNASAQPVENDLVIDDSSFAIPLRELEEEARRAVNG